VSRDPALVGRDPAPVPYDPAVVDYDPASVPYDSGPVGHDPDAVTRDPAPVARPWAARGPRRRNPLVVVGDALLDRDLDGRAERLAPDAPVPVVDDPAERRRAGGAALAATLAAWEGREVVLVTALAPDEAGVVLRELLERAGVEVVDLGLTGETPEKIRVRAAGRSLLRVDRGGRPGVVGPLGRDGRGALGRAAAVLVSDYGRGVAAEPGVREALAGLPARTPLVWDPHPRGPAPVPGARLATPNRAEAAGFAPEVAGDGLAAMTARARALARRWAAAGVAVTLGAGGALLVEGAGAPLVVPAPAAAGGDPCGAGDRFAAAAAGLLADGALPSEAVAGAVAAASAFVATGGAATVDLDIGQVDLNTGQVGLDTGQRGAPKPPSAGGRAPEREGRPRRVGGRTAVHSPVGSLPGRSLAGASPTGGSPAGASLAGASPAGASPAGASLAGASPAGASPAGGSPMERALHLIGVVRAQGGTVVATGGCFDLLHAGHVATLRAARALGDCLVVCLNSDDSVRRLKGLERPLVPEADRVAVLEALGCVDAVVPFDERTPEAVLQRLRPDVFAKGGDYALADLPEAALLASWGGQAVVLPYLEGRSTTQLMKEVVRRDSH
jgi:D-beta-D-heptose 7-phosphate kinase / D-beta-D-heptose 1-phosphate adenosyltransferase